MSILQWDEHISQLSESKTLMIMQQPDLADFIIRSMFFFFSRKCLLLQYIRGSQTMVHLTLVVLGLLQVVFSVISISNFFS